MNGLYVNGERIEVAGTISFTEENPIFSHEYRGDASLPFTIPWTDENLRKLGQPFRMELSRPLVEWPAAYIIGGRKIEGTLFLLDARAGTASFVTKPVILGELAEKNIRDFMTDLIQLSTEVMELSIFIDGPNTAGVALTFKLNNRSYSLTSSATIDDTVQDIAALIDDPMFTVTYIPSSPPVPPAIELTSTTTGTPGIFRYIDMIGSIGTGFTADTEPGLGSSYQEVFWIHALNQDIRAEMLAAASGNSSTHLYAFPEMLNGNAYGSNNIDFLGVINAFNQSTAKYLTNTFTVGANFHLDKNARTICPLVYLIPLLTRIFDEAGYIITGSFITNDTSKQLSFYNNVNLDALVETQHFGTMNVLASEFILGDHLPDMTVDELITGLINMFGLVIRPDREKPEEVIISFAKDLLESGSVHPLERIVERSPAVPLENRMGAEFRMTPDRGDTIANRDTQVTEAFISGEGGEVITTAFSPPPMSNTYPPFTGNRPLPNPAQLCTSAAYGQENGFSPRLLVYVGIQPDYPYATRTTIDENGDTVTDFALIWEGDDGLFKNFWAGFISDDRRRPRFRFIGAVRGLEPGTRFFHQNKYYLWRSVTSKLLAGNEALFEMECVPAPIP